MMIQRLEKAVSEGFALRGKEGGGNRLLAVRSRALVLDLARWVAVGSSRVLIWMPSLRIER